jgi:hypothetical protein
MTTDTQAIVLIGGLITRFLEQFSIIIISGICIYFGYRLFYIASADHGGMEASGVWGKLRLTRTAPGTFFTLFGCAVLVTSLSRGIDVKTDQFIDHLAVTENIGAIGVDQSALSLKPTQCARAADYALLQLRTSPPASGSLATATERYNETVSGLEDILAHCVDAAFGNGSYRRYKKVSEMSKDGPADVNDEFKRSFNQVSRLLAD